MITLSHYSRIKDNYCISYFGPCEDYIVQLRLLRPFIEESLPGLRVYIACKDQSVHWLKDCDRIIKLSEIKIKRTDVAYTLELSFDGKYHPIQKLMDNINIKNYVIKNHCNEERTVKCVILTKGEFPTKSLSQHQIDVLADKVEKDGYEVYIDKPVEDSGLVIGVEHPGLFHAASLGVNAILVSTGVGANLFKNMFPHLSVIPATS